jgi:hypothetical protein
MTPLNFSYGGYVRNIVYAITVCDLEHLQQRITAAVEAVMPGVLHHTLTETECCLDVCRVTNGALIKTY